MSKDSKQNIFHPLVEPLSSLLGHKDHEGIFREVLFGLRHCDDAPIDIAIHHVKEVSPDSTNGEFMDREVHEFDEINLILSSRGESLRYRYELDDEIFEVVSPASVFIRSGTYHRMTPICGSGSFVCIRLSRVISKGYPK